MDEYTYTKMGNGVRVRRSHSYVYFIEDHQGNIKIGLANHPDRRLAELQCAHANPLTLRAIIAVPQSEVFKTEKALHAKYRDDHIAREWFKNSEDLETFMRQKLDTLPLGDLVIKGKKRQLASRRQDWAGEMHGYA